MFLLCMKQVNMFMSNLSTQMSYFQKWAAVSRLTFERVKTEGEADITFLWATRSHGDVSAFDGPGGSLAHAFYPDAGGDVHMDDDENWSIEVDVASKFF